MYQYAESERYREKLKLQDKYRNKSLAQCRLGLLNINQKVTYNDNIEN